ncbi:MAG: aldehyde dehydrogenase family protein [Carbonactinosporaceae bacterium]
MPRGRAADIEAGVQAVQAAFPAWRDTSPAVRAELLQRWAALCREREREIDTLESMEVGRPHRGPSPVGRILTYTAGVADKITGQTLPTTTPDVLGMTIREPYGACGSIIPWNGARREDPPGPSRHRRRSRRPGHLAAERRGELHHGRVVQRRRRGDELSRLPR